MGRTSKHGSQPRGNRTKKRMKCSPEITNDQQVEGSCYTPSILYKLRDAYNKAHPEDKLHTKNNPKKLFWELTYKLRKKCSKEDCWLDLLPQDQKEHLDKYMFAPDHPKEWNSNPDEWLSNFDIMNVLRQYEREYPCFKLLGPSPIDFDTKISNSQCVEADLCNFELKHYIDNNITKIGISFNLDDHNGPGFHWVSLFIDIKNKFIFYYDSALYKFPGEIETFVDRVRKQSEKLGFKLEFIKNRFQHQSGSSECGMYSLFFIITMLTGKWGGIGKHMSREERIQLFERKRVLDKTVFRFRKEYFNEP
jgi:Ulp1 protease family, C-terminal catalytic domain